MAKIILHPLTKNDLEFLLEVRNHQSTRSQLKNDAIFTLEECKEWFKTLKSPWYLITNKDLDKVGYVRVDGDIVGVDIHPNFRRKGYARKAYKKYLEGKMYAELDVFEDNHAKSLYEELGFKETGDSQLIRGRKYLKMIYENRN